MAKKPTTVYQDLTKALIFGFDNKLETQQKSINSYTLNTSGNDKTILKTTNKGEYEKTKEQLRQEKYLANMWRGVNFNLGQQNALVTNNLKLMYRDAEIMDGFPEIGAALDIVAEESNVPDFNGHIISIASTSDRIRKILEDLFINRLYIHVNLPMWTRTMCKYGNAFVFLNIDGKKGIIGARQLPTYEVERLDDGGINAYITKPNSMETEFVWMGRNNGVPIKNWQMAHFRLLTDSTYLPYGCLVGDTRIETEYGYKNIENIMVGDKVWTFDIKKQEKVLGSVTKQMFKGIQDTNKIYTKHNYIVGTDDHKLLTYSNDQLIYKEIKDLLIGDLLVIDNEYGKKYKEIKIDKSNLTRLDCNLNKSTHWWYDNLKYVPDIVDEKFAKFFGFMIGDGWISPNNEICFATGEYERFNKEFADYLKLITNGKIRFIKPFNYESRYEFSQVVCSSKMLSIIMKRMGFNGKFDSKRIPSWVYSSSNEIKKAFLDGLMIADGSFNIDKYDSLRCGIEMSNEQLIKDIKILVQSLGYKSGNISHRNKTTPSILKNGRKIQSKNTSYYFYYYESYNKQEKKYDIINRLNEGFKTEKIIKIEKESAQPVYDITIDNNNENFYANGIITHNCSFLHKARRHFRMLSMMEDMMLIYRLERSIERRVFKIFVGNIDDADIPAYVNEIANTFKRTPIVDPETGQLDLKKTSMSVDMDIFIPVKDRNEANPIDTLPSASNIDKIEDLKYIQSKLYTALRVPKEFLNYDEAGGDGKNLALKDIRFTRTINRIQQALLMELTKIAIVHLYLLGFKDEINNFRLSMNSPSTQANILRLEELGKKVELVKSATQDPGNGMPVMSMIRAQREILGWTDEQITQNLQEIRLEKGLSAEIEKTSQIIKRTGVFDKTDKIYGAPNATYIEEDVQNEEGGSGDGGFGGGGGFSGGDMSFDEGGDMGGTEEDIDSGLTDEGQPENNTEGQTDNTEEPNNNEENVNFESKKVKKQNKNVLQESFFDKYDKYINKEKELKENTFKEVELLDKTFLINDEINKMLKIIK